MEVEFDPEKSARNERERGLPFELAAHLEWSRAVVATDDRHDYGEERFLALVPMDGRIYAVVYTIRWDRPPGRGRRPVQIRRIISFRKANDREEKVYEKATTDR